MFSTKYSPAEEETRSGVIDSRTQKKHKMLVTAWLPICNNKRDTNKAYVTHWLIRAQRFCVCYENTSIKIH